MTAEEASPTARALLALELIQNAPGITADRLGFRLGVSSRAVRRYVGILREADIPIDSVPGRYGGYRVGRGFRVPPLMFSTAEALALVMAALEGRRAAAEPDEPAGQALSKIIRVLPAAIAGTAEAIRQVSSKDNDSEAPKPDPEIAAVLFRASIAGHRVRLDYQLGEDKVRTMDVDPWALCVRHGLWYLLGWSHTAQARRVLRVDRVASASQLAEIFTAPEDLQPMRVIEEHFAEGWKYSCEVLIDAPIAELGWCVPRTLGRLEDTGDGRSRLAGSTEQPDWYARQLTGIPVAYQILGSPELRAAARLLGDRLVAAAG